MTWPAVLWFHPAYVHFPIAFYFLELGLLIGWQAQGDESLHHFSDIALEAGYWSMLVAMLMGLITAGGLAGIRGKVVIHAYSALGLFAFYSFRRVYARKADVHTAHYPWMRIGGSVLGCALVLWVAYWGGLIQP